MRTWNEETIRNEIMSLANQFEPARMPSSREVKSMTGSYALSNAIQKSGGYKYWADLLGLDQKHSETKLAIEWECKIANAFRAAGYDVERTSVKYPYDLLIDGCVKVDVKVARTSFVRGSAVHAYRIVKPQQTCDFYICCEADSDDVYVIPANVCKGQKQIEMGMTTKYAVYKNAFDLIDNAVTFYSSLVAPHF